MKKIYSFIFLITLLFILFSCDLPSNYTSQYVNVKKFKDGSSYLTTVNENALKAATEINDTNTIYAKYNTDVVFDFKYSKKKKSVTVTETNGMDEDNKVKGKFKFADLTEFESFVNALKRAIAYNESQIEAKQAGQFKAKIIVNKEKNSDSGSKTITVFKGLVGTNKKEKQAFFDLGEESNATAEGTSNGVAEVFSYMITEESIKIIQAFLDKIKS